MLDATPLWYFINERHAMWLRKHHAAASDPIYVKRYDLGVTPAGVSLEETKAGVFTHDPILSKYRFCNVFRELDRVTIWIDQHIRQPFAKHEHLWYMCAVARTINWPLTLGHLLKTPGAWPFDYRVFDPRYMTQTLDAWKEQGNKVYTGAYMIRAESDFSAEWFHWTKQRYISEIVLGRLWADRENWRDFFKDHPTLEQTWRRFQRDFYVGWGPFMAFQAVLDMRHTPLLSSATDASTWAAIGPGSMRGLNRLHGRDISLKLKQEQALEEMTELLQLSRTSLLPHVPPLEMEDVQNSLCETDKYLRTKSGDGKPRTKYTAGRGY